MAITTESGLISGLRPQDDSYKIGATFETAAIWRSYWYSTGVPGAANVPTPGINGETCTNAMLGALPFNNPASGNSYLARLAAVFGDNGGATVGTLMLCDRLWQNSGIAPATTTLQDITPVALPARDRNGSTNGEDVMFALEVSTATANASAVTTISAGYTNSGGTGTRTATISSFPATALAGTFVPFNLQAGDIGIRQIDDITLGTSLAPSGSPAIHLVGYRVIAMYGAMSFWQNYPHGPIKLGLPRLYDSSCLFWLFRPSAGSAAIHLYPEIGIAQG